MLANTVLFRPPIIVKRSAINVTAGSVGMFVDRTTLAIVTFANNGDATRVRNALPTSYNPDNHLSIYYLNAKYYPVAPSFKISLQTPGGSTQLTVTLILISFALVILVALYSRFRHGLPARPTVNDIHDDSTALNPVAR